MKISDHISYKEATRSNTASRYGINNDPGQTELERMKIIAKKVFEPLRRAVGGPIRINSFFRSKALNKKLGGSKKSQHMEGRAMDLDDTHGHMSNADMFNYIKNELSFDQLIWEFGSSTNPDWVHVSYVSEEKNRKICLRAYRDNGVTKYEIY